MIIYSILIVIVFLIIAVTFFSLPIYLYTITQNQQEYQELDTELGLVWDD